MTYDTIFFDIGNTLFFFNYDFLRDFLKERFDFEVSTLELGERHTQVKNSVVADGSVEKLTHEELWNEVYRRWFAAINMNEEIIPTVIAAIHEHPFKHMFWARMLPGTRQMLDWFKLRGFKLGVISNAEGQIKRLIEHVGLTDHFDIVIDSGDVGFEKPDERIFKHALNKIGAKADSTIHVGDLLDIDVLGAKNVGITPVLVDSESLHKDAGCLSVKLATDLPKLKIFSSNT